MTISQVFRTSPLGAPTMLAQDEVKFDRPALKQWDIQIATFLWKIRSFHKLFQRFVVCYHPCLSSGMSPSDTVDCMSVARCLSNRWNNGILISGVRQGVVCCRHAPYWTLQHNKNGRMHSLLTHLRGGGPNKRDTSGLSSNPCWEHCSGCCYFYSVCSNEMKATVCEARDSSFRGN